MLLLYIYKIDNEGDITGGSGVDFAHQAIESVKKNLEFESKVLIYIRGEILFHWIKIDDYVATVFALFVFFLQCNVSIKYWFNFSYSNARRWPVPSQNISGCFLWFSYNRGLWTRPISAPSMGHITLVGSCHGTTVSKGKKHQDLL